MSRRRGRGLRIGLVAGALLIASGGPRGQLVDDAAPGRLTVADAGRPIVFRYSPRDSTVVAALARTVGGFRPAPIAPLRLPPDTFNVAVAPSEEAFRAMTAGQAPDWGLAVAFPGQARIVMRSPRLTGDSGADPATVLRHELSHLYLGAALGPGTESLPRWFHEGFAALYAGEWRWVAPVRLAWGRITGRLTPLGRLQDGFPADADPQLAYMQSMAAVRALRDRGGDAALSHLLARMRAGASFDRALRETYGLTQDQFYADWQGQLGRTYGWAVALTDERGLWGALAIFVLLIYWLRRRSIRAEIERRRRAEDAALGPPEDHSLGVEEWERYWEWDDDEAWRPDDEEGF